MERFRRTLRALLRLLLALAAILGAVHLFRLALVPLLQQWLHTDADTTSLIRRTGISLCAVGAYWAYVRLVEKRAVPELHPRPLPIALGAAGGALAIGLAMLVLLAVGAYEVVQWRGLQGGLAGTAALILIAAMLEELVFRAVLFRILEQAWGTWPALILSSAIFAAVHYENLGPDVGTAALVTTMLAGTLVGVFWGMVFVVSRNLWVATANHAAWNFTIILAGVPLSGLEDWLRLAPMTVRVHGPHWLTGGEFGPEDSAPGIVLTLIGVIVAHRIRRRQQARAAAALPAPAAA